MVRRSVLLLVALLAVFLTGCGANISVLRQASPNPFVGQKSYALTPLDTKGLLVGELSEDKYLESKDADQKKSFTEDKDAMAQLFESKLVESARDAGIQVGPAGKAPFVIHARVIRVEPGFYAVIASAPSEVTIRVSISSPDGKVLDEIELTHQTDSKSGMSVGGISTNPSSGGRLRDDAAAIGESLADYLAERAGL